LKTHIPFIRICSHIIGDWIIYKKLAKRDFDNISTVRVEHSNFCFLKEINFLIYFHHPLKLIVQVYEIF